jgi:hypothetical protein
VLEGKIVLGPLPAAGHRVLRVLGNQRHQVADGQKHGQKRQEPQQLGPGQANAVRLAGGDPLFDVGAVERMNRQLAGGRRFGHGRRGRRFRSRTNMQRRTRLVDCQGS